MAKKEYDYKNKARSYDYEMKPGETVQSYYRRIAKVADQRLVRLEKLAEAEGTDVNKWAYKRAMADISNWSAGGKRFNTKPPADGRALRAKINDIKAFLGSESSTKQGIKDVYQRRLESLNKNNSTHYQIDDLADLFDSALWKKMESKYSSDEILKAIGYIHDNATDDKALEALKAKSVKDGKVPKFTGNKFQDKLINEMLQQGDSVDAMYKYFKSI